MRLFLPIALMLSALSAHAVDFTSVSRSEPVTLIHAAGFTAYVDVSLNVSCKEATSQQLYLRLRYIIGTDTLHDNLAVTGGHDGVVKQLLLMEGERLTVQLLLNNAEVESVSGLQGSLRAGTNTRLEVGTEVGRTTFVGSVWHRDQNPLFRVKFDEPAPRDVQLEFHLTGNYEFDRLHFKVKVISPEQGILFLERSVKVTDGTHLSLGPKTLRLSLEGVNFSYAGSYYVQVMHQMMPDRVNGVDRVGYTVTAQ